MIHHTQRERIVFDVVILCSIFLLPSYVALFLSGLLILRFKNYIEFPITALIVDVLYKPYGGTYLGLFGISLIILIIAEYFRDRIKSKGKDTL